MAGTPEKGAIAGRARRGRWLAGLFAALILLILFTPVAMPFSRPLVMKATLRPSDAVIVLGSGAYPDGSLSSESLQRLIEGIRLYRKGWGKALVISGGAPSAGRMAPALSMGRLAVELGVDSSAVLIENRSTSTFENAREVARLFRQHHWKTGILITSALHSYRAHRTFERQGVAVVSAPAPFIESYRASPDGRWRLFYTLLYEYAAIAWYWWNDRL